MRNYPSKLFLFGEYSVLQGSQALAIAYNQFNGRAIFLKKKRENDFDFYGLIHYLEAIKDKIPFLNLDKFKILVEQGWYFDSNIPVGMGLGSSGALCAAIYDHCKTGDPKQSEILKCLGLIEGYFHGKSSGVDPLISYLNQSMFFESFSKYLNLNKKISLQGLRVFLINTGVSRQANAFIQIFQRKCEESDYINTLKNEYIPINNKIIKNIIENVEINSLMEQLSKSQLNLFSQMYTEKMTLLSNRLLDEKSGFIKLCGAGGGGYYLAFIPDNLDPNIVLKSEEKIEVVL